jgi:predicted unusual protein kinase regulating ubiquinone biosynthesis (AarF/ABC1/UbiB family)
MANDGASRGPIPTGWFERGSRLAGQTTKSAARFVGTRFKAFAAPEKAEQFLQGFHEQTAQQLVDMLGEMKGAAMKLGQLASFYELSLPGEYLATYRDALTMLQNHAPPMDPDASRAVIEQEFGRPLREVFSTFEDKAVAAASIGQVHEASLPSGERVAVKVQYPGAADALRSDLRQLARVARSIGPAFPGIDIKPLVAELQARVGEELDYRLEAEAQHAFADAFRDDPDFLVPDVLAHTDKVLVSEWIDSPASLARLIAEGTQEERNHYGQLYARFLFQGPQRVGMLHADPHPGNFRVLPTADGELGGIGVVDYGAVARLPEHNLPRMIGSLIRIAMYDGYDEVLEGLRAEGFVKPNITIDPDDLRDYLSPFIEPARSETFAFSRAWMRGQFQRLQDPRQPGSMLALRLNLPPSYLLIHRVWIGSIGVLCQLEAELPFRAMLDEALPGFAEA